MIRKTWIIEQYKRQCSINDLWEFIEQNLEVKGNGLPSPVYWVTNRDLRVFRDKGSVWVATINEKIVAAIVLNENTIDILCVRKRYRKRGIGKDLVIFVESFLKKHSRTKFMHVWSLVAFKAKAFYEKLGFENVERTMWDETWHLRKALR